MLDFVIEFMLAIFIIVLMIRWIAEEVIDAIKNVFKS